MYHVYEDGYRITDKPMTMTEIFRLFGHVKSIEKLGYRLIRSEADERVSEDTQPSTVTREEVLHQVEIDKLMEEAREELERTVGTYETYGAVLRVKPNFSKKD